MIKIIAAKSLNDIIGVNNELPWVIPEDLKNFKKITTANEDPKDNIILMGWNTWVSLGEKPLPNRTNIIVSRSLKPVPRKSTVRLERNLLHVLYKYKHKDIFVIGGESVFRYCLPLADEMYLTRVLIHIETNKNDVVSKFPHFIYENWKEKSRSMLQFHNEIPYEFLHLKRLT